MTRADEIRRMKSDEVADCERILRSLPDWFGIEPAIVDYVRDIGVMTTWVACVSGEIVSFATIRRHGPFSAEIQVMAVTPALHGQRHGRRLVEHAEHALRSEAVEFLQVKTLAPSHPDTFYERTRGFYERLGFKPLEPKGESESPQIEEETAPAQDERPEKAQPAGARAGEESTASKES